MELDTEDYAAEQYNAVCHLTDCYRWRQYSVLVVTVTTVCLCCTLMQLGSVMNAAHLR